MKLVGVKEFYNITRAKIISAVNCCVVVFVCATATFAVDTALNSKTVQAMPVETSEATSIPVEETEPDITESAVIPETSAESSAVTSETSAAGTSETTKASETSATSEETETSATEETTAATEETTTAATEETTTAETTEKITEKELYKAVYATTTLNVRSGPGTEYDIVKSLSSGDQIDVVAVTSNGWYKTYNGNYVSKDYTTDTKPKPTPTPKPTQKQTEQEVTEVTTTARAVSYSGEAHECKITFYGPVLMRDGSYSTTTATGTTCTQGRTCGADWSVFPAGTVIYIENDPLGGDGYYTVEDTGPGAKGYHIDIYADDGETGNYSTCYRNVYVA